MNTDGFIIGALIVGAVVITVGFAVWVLNNYSGGGGGGSRRRPRGTGPM